MAIFMEKRNEAGETILEKSYEGCVLATRELNGYNDSDFYAVVWDEKTQSIRNVTYATTRGWTYNNSATVDATPEVIAKAGAYAVVKAFEYLRDRDVEEAKTPTRGKSVIVVRGRKVPIGTKAEIFWYGETRKFYGCPRGGYNAQRPNPRRVGILLPDGNKAFIAAENVEVVDPENWITPGDELLPLAERARGNAVMQHVRATSSYAVL